MICALVGLNTEFQGTLLGTCNQAVTSTSRLRLRARLRGAPEFGFDVTPVCHAAAVGELDARISEMEASGYRVLTRGSGAVVLTRDARRRRTPLRVTAVAISLALLAFGVWRQAWLFSVVGLVGAALIIGDWWLERRSMTVRLTLGADGRVREELIRLGDV